MSAPVPMTKVRFRTIFKKLLPSWLSSGEGELVHYSIGLVMDAWWSRLKHGTYARFPTRAPHDALAAIGRDRRIVRGIDEGRADYAARVIPWLDDHQIRGNPFRLCEQLRSYCQADVMVRTVDRRGNWFTVEADGTRSYSLDTGSWDWDAEPASSFSRFWVIIYPTANGKPWSRLTLGEYIFGRDTLGTTATKGQVAAVRAIVRDWRPEGTRCEWIIIAFDDTKFDPAAPEPNGAWGPWGDGASPSVPVRETTAAYWDGTGLDRTIV